MRCLAAHGLLFIQKGDTMQKCIIHRTLDFAVLFEHAQCMSAIGNMCTPSKFRRSRNLLKLDPDHLFTCLHICRLRPGSQNTHTADHV